MAGPSPLPSTHGASRPRRRRCHRHRHRRPAVRAEATNRDSDWPRVCRASRTCRKRATCCDVELLGGGMSEAYSSLRVMLFDILQCSFLYVYLTPSSELQQHAPPAACLPAAATVSRGTLRPVIYLGRECAASVTSYPPCVDRRGILQHLYSTALLPRPSCVPFVTFAHPGGQVCLPWLLASDRR